VLTWQGLDTAQRGLSTSQLAFSRHLALLKHLGYTTISTSQWADFRAGRTEGMPAKPILLTFEDGKLATYRAADAVLQRMGMHAAMFVSTGQIEKGDPNDLRWSELHRMVQSGRWDVEPHAHLGASKVTISADGTQAPYYAAKRFTRSGGEESIQDWEARTSEDLFAVRERFANQGMEPHVLAVPYGDYGQRSTNDVQIPRLLTDLLTRQFGSFFVQDQSDPGFTQPGSGATERFVMRTGTNLDQLYGWLREHSAPADHHRNQR
jgi:hypothetical protein